MLFTNEELRNAKRMYRELKMLFWSRERVYIKRTVSIVSYYREFALEHEMYEHLQAMQIVFAHRRAMYNRERGC